MTPLVLAISLLAGDVSSGRELPRSLECEHFPLVRAESEFDAPRQAQAAKEHPRLDWWIGGHLGVADAFDATDAAFLVGVGGRVHILPWLGAEATLDLQFGGAFEGGDISVFGVPFEFSALFYVPVPEDWAVRPYGLAGVGFMIADIDYRGALSSRGNQTVVEPLFLLGVGAEWRLQPNVMLDAGFRFAFVSDPGGMSGNSLDFLQFTIGINFGLGE